VVSCNKKENESKKKNSENLQNKTTQENIFSNNSIEKIIETFSKKSKENRVSIGNFEKLAYENKNYYYARINSKSDAIYALDYSGISATSIFLKVGKVDGANLGIIENMVVNLIQVSDEKINESEARVIYTKILASMGEKELSSLLTYTNGIIYGIRIDSVTANAGLGYETSALTAAIIGGVTFEGGKGSIAGAFLGCILMGVISNAMNILQVETYIQTIITGIIIAAAVVFSNVASIRGRKC